MKWFCNKIIQKNLQTFKINVNLAKSLSNIQNHLSPFMLRANNWKSIIDLNETKKSVKLLF